MHRIDRAIRGIGGRNRPQARIGEAEADLLALHIGGIEPERGELRVAGAFRPVTNNDTGQEQDRHDHVKRPALTLILDHASESVGERRRDQKDVEHFKEVAERRRILIRDRRVGVPEAAAIGAELLDGDLRGGRTLADRLLGSLKRGRVDISAEVLRDALPDEYERRNDRERQQDVERAAGEIDPEIADGLGRSPRKAADQRDGERNTGSGRDEVLGGEACHLGQVAERALATIVLPVGVGGEANRRVEGQVRSYGRHARRIERQKVLQAHERVDTQEAGRIEQQHGDRVGDPSLLARLVDAGNTIKAALDRAENRREKCALALEHAGHEAPERNDESGEDHEINRDLNPTVESHGAPLRISRG